MQILRETKYLKKMQNNIEKIKIKIKIIKVGKLIIKIKYKKKFKKFTAQLRSSLKLKKQSQHKYNPIYQFHLARFLWCLSLNETKTSIT